LKYLRPEARRSIEIGSSLLQASGDKKQMGSFTVKIRVSHGLLNGPIEQSDCAIELSLLNQLLPASTSRIAILCHRRFS
jgi:hypothetical protein